MLSPYESSKYWNAVQEKNIENAKEYFSGVSLNSIRRYEQIATKKYTGFCAGINRIFHGLTENELDPTFRLLAARKILKENEEKLEEKVQ